MIKKYVFIEYIIYIIYIIGGGHDVYETAKKTVSGTLGGTVSRGCLWGSAACTEAADTYVIDAGNPTPDPAHRVPDENWISGVAGGFTNSAAPLTGKTLIVDGVTYPGFAYGGYNQGSGGVTGNHLIIRNGGGLSHSAYGGRAPGVDACGNTVTINGGSAQLVYGGYAEGAGNADGNTVILTGGSVGTVIRGGHTRGTGNTNGNTVIITGGSVGTVRGGDADEPNNAPVSGNADGNTVDIGAIYVNDVTGGFSYHGTANNNTIHLRGTRVGDRVRVGNAPTSTGNTLAIHAFATWVGGFEYVQNLHFYLPEGTTGNSGTMLTSGVSQDISGVHIGVGVAGRQSALQKGDVVSLLKTTNGTLTTAAVLANDVSGMQGISLRYKFDLEKRNADELIAIVTEAAVMEQTKSLVETRAAASALLNGGADLLSGMGMDAAETAAALPDAATADGANAAIESSSYELWAAQGGSSERIETGSYVDAKGWSLNVGFAKQDAVGAGKLTYGPFVEYGRGSYDSYLDDGTHGDGSSSYIGGGFMAKWAGADQSYVEASLHAGRIKSDYSGNISGTSTNYDASNSYLAGHIGIGRKFDLGTDAALDGYAKYFWSHQGGASATLTTGEQYDFGSVTSSRVRLGVRYTKKLMPRSEFYAGLAWEYEFDGDATATYQGYATPSPSLKGSSGMLELGYRFTPKEGSVSYGLNLTGWQGKRSGITGGANVSWAF